ncbi:MAG: LacI family DNA-binding transcriptional regulator, partial [Spirochaetia bacterium]
MANATLQDIAKAVGVSLTTASMALSGKGRISLEVRSKVLAAAGQLGYKSRNVSGRGAQRTRSVGIIHLDDRSHEWNFIRPILIELELALHRQGYA